MLTAFPDTDVLTMMPEANQRPDRLLTVAETNDTGIVSPEVMATAPVTDTSCPETPTDMEPVTATMFPEIDV